jgi:hypothetical protein
VWLLVLGLVGMVLGVPIDLAAQVAPTLIPLAGELRTPEGQPRTGTVQLAIAIYDGQDDPAPKWTEYQKVTLDALGRYRIEFGAAQADGLPPEIFLGTAGPRWIGVTAEGDVEQPRVMLVAVPYAARAASADTIAGTPASSFVLSSTIADEVRTVLHKEGVRTASSNDGGDVSTSAVTANFLQKGDGLGGTTDSAIFENGGTTSVGTTVTSVFNANTTTPKLLFSAAGVSAVMQAVRHTSPGGGGAIMQLSATRGTAANSYTPVLTNDGLGTLNFLGSDGSQFVAGSQIVGFAAANAAPNQMFGGLSFRTNNGTLNTPDERLRITHTGNIGIGTPNPNYLTQVHAASGHSVLQMTNGATGSGPADGAYIGVLSGLTDLRIANQEAGAIDLFTVGAPRLTVTAGGNVGIGTQTPMSRLHVTNGDLSMLQSVGNSNKIMFTQDPSAHFLRSANFWVDVVGNENEVFRVFGGAGSTTEFLRVTGTGAVGIGTTNPMSKLDVVGNGLVRGRLRSGGFNAPGNLSSIAGSFTPAGTVTLGTATNVVTGSGTSFLSQLSPGDRIDMSAQGAGSRPVLSIASDTSLTVSSPFSQDLAGVSMTVWPSTLRMDSVQGVPQLVFNDQGNLQIGAQFSSTSRLTLTQGNRFTGTSASNNISNGNVSVITNSTMEQNAGGILGLGGSRGSAVVLFGGLRGAKENDTVDNPRGYLGLYTVNDAGTFLERARLDSNGNLGVGTRPISQRIEVEGGVRLNTVTPKPTCDATTRGTFWVTQQAAGVDDTVEVCVKNATEAFLWRSVF